MCSLSLFFVILFINDTSPQIIPTALNGFTPGSNTMPATVSGLIPGYDSVNDRIWLIGAIDSTVVYYFNMNTKTFTDNTNNYLSFTTTPSVNAQGYTQMNNILYFAFNTKLQKFDLTVGSITDTITFNSYFSDIRAPCLANNGQYIFLVGGESISNPATASTRFTVYDTIGNTWINGDSLQYGVRQHTCNIINNYLYVYGGRGTDNVVRTNVARIYIGNMGSIASANWDNSWETMQANFYHPRSVVVDDLVYIVGGRNSDTCCGVGVGDDRIQIMDSSGNMQLSTVSLNDGRSSPGLIAVQHVIYIFGGTYDNSAFNTWEYSNIITWSPTNHPTYNPTVDPTFNPTINPTINPTFIPTINPTINPTFIPTVVPTIVPTDTPTRNPTLVPVTFHPTTSIPTNIPTTTPTNIPTITPTFRPTATPTTTPTQSNGEQQDSLTTNIPSDEPLEDDLNDNSDSQELGIMTIIIVVGIVLIVTMCCIALCGFIYLWRRKHKEKGIEKHVQPVASNSGSLEMTNNRNISSEKMPGSVDFVSIHTHSATHPTIVNISNQIAYSVPNIGQHVQPMVNKMPYVQNINFGGQSMFQMGNQPYFQGAQTMVPMSMFPELPPPGPPPGTSVNSFVDNAINDAINEPGSNNNVYNNNVYTNRKIIESRRETDNSELYGIDDDEQQMESPGGP